MRRSHLLLPTLKENPSHAHTVSHQLMMRAGMIHPVASGIYTWLPLGLRVLQKISDIIREEQDAIGAQEVLFPTIQPESLWQESGRTEAYGPELLRFLDRAQRPMLYGPTAEEMATDILRSYVKSYRDLPKNIYNIQWKFRDEIRPRFGVMRGREFLMKDAYTFDASVEDALNSYKQVFESYLAIFRRLQLQVIPMLQRDTGPIGGNQSHEFLILSPGSGESEIVYDAEALDQLPAHPVMEDYQRVYSAEKTYHDQNPHSFFGDHLRQTQAIEVGHIFYFGTKYTRAMGAQVTGPSGALIDIEMGSHGIGVSRLVGAIIEASHDAKGIVWPEAIAPYQAALLCLDPGMISLSDALYAELRKRDIDVLYDDRLDVRPGEKWAEADLIGMPYQIVVGKKYHESQKLEWKDRKTGEVHFFSQDEIVSLLSSKADAIKRKTRFKTL